MYGEDAQAYLQKEYIVDGRFVDTDGSPLHADTQLRVRAQWDDR